jgi:hypothetical protein
MDDQLPPELEDSVSEEPEDLVTEQESSEQQDGQSARKKLRRGAPSQATPSTGAAANPGPRSRRQAPGTPGTSKGRTRGADAGASGSQQNQTPTSVRKRGQDLRTIAEVSGRNF